MSNCQWPTLLWTRSEALAIYITNVPQFQACFLIDLFLPLQQECNNRGQCSCDVGFSGTACETSSSDSSKPYFANLFHYSILQTTGPRR